MTPTLYLFCNESYGSPYMAIARRFAKQYRIKVIVIFSGKYILLEKVGDGFLAQARAFARKRIQEQRLKNTYHLPIRIISDINSPFFFEQVRSCDYGVISGFNQIFKTQTIDRFGLIVNFHPSILPLYRGPVPSIWCVRNEEEKTGFTLHKVTERIDEGEILYQEEIVIRGINDPDMIDLLISERGALLFWKYLSHLFLQVPWEIARVDAYHTYRHHVRYASFPRNVSV